MTSLGFSSVAVTAERIEEDPEVWKKVADGEFQIVYATPEMILDAQSYFQKTILKQSPKSIFIRRLVAVAVDECHLVWDWRSFRKAYADLGPFRDTIMHIPFVGLSATLAPNVAAYFHKTCRLNWPTVEIDVGIRRDNINIIVSPINRLGTTQLLDLIPPEAITTGNSGLIPKTLIFHDNIDAGIDIANALISRMRNGFDPSTSDILVGNYYGSIDAMGKKLVKDRLTSGKTRIVVCTDAFGLGINISDIERVVQWEVDDRLMGSTLSQRIGRAARDPLLTGVAIIYIQKVILDAMAKHGIAIEGSWEQSSSSSSHNPTEEDVLEPDNPSEGLHVAPLAMDPDSKKFALYMKAFGLPVRHDTKDKVTQHLHGLYRDSKNLQEALQHAKEATQGTREAPVPMVKKLDPPVLWTLFTQGCRHMVLGAVFKDLNLYERSHRSWCCDWCAYHSSYDSGTFQETAKISTMTSILNPDPLAPPPIPKRGSGFPPTKRSAKEVTPRHAAVVHEKLLQYRKMTWKCLDIPDTEPSIILPDHVLMDISTRKNLRRLTKPTNLMNMIKAMGIPPQFNLLNEEDTGQMYSIIDNILSWTMDPVRILPSIQVPPRTVPPQPRTVPSQPRTVPPPPRTIPPLNELKQNAIPRPSGGNSASKRTMLQNQSSDKENQPRSSSDGLPRKRTKEKTNDDRNLLEALPKYVKLSDRLPKKRTASGGNHRAHGQAEPGPENPRMRDILQRERRSSNARRTPERFKRG
jgi:hypothetical protein